MANKSLTDLTARTATADSDLLHINSGGTDYKEQKIDFLQGSLKQAFNNTSLLTTQVDALALGKIYFGDIGSYGKQTETGMPFNDNAYLKVQTEPYSTYACIEAWSVNSPHENHWIKRKANGTWGDWVKQPTRSEITSLNNSLTQCLTTTPGIITSGRDLNDYKSNGLYIIQSGVTNSPSSWCALLVIGTPTTYGVHQIAFSFSAFYVRSYTGSPMAWTNWRSLTFS